MTIGIILQIIGPLLAIGASFYFGKFVHEFIHNLARKSFTKEDRKHFYLLASGIGIASLLSGLGTYLIHEEWANDRALYMSLFLFGLLVFGASASLLIASAIIRIKKEKRDASLSKELNFVFYISIVTTVAGFLIFMEGLAPWLSYPLTSGFAIGKDGFYWVSAANRAKSGDFHLAWYGVIIVSGALVSYFVADRVMFKEYKRHGLLDIVILIAFPAGIIGARVWYVVGNFEREFANGKGNPFAIWDGGLTILGGAVAGVLAGYLLIKFARKYCDPRFTMDACVPSILLAQAIGRWGNFFNNEVYGQTVSEAGWMWLPSWIRNQMHFDGYTGRFLEAGMMNVPLFLIESVFNIAGYFIIAYLLGKGLKKYLVRGDLTGFYFIWYGIVRVIMEPMRNSSFNMGADNAWSICNSLIYIVIGLALCTYFHFFDYYKKNENHKAFVLPLVSASITLLAIFFMFLPSFSGGYTDGNNNASLLSTYTGFEVLFKGQAPLLLTGFIIAILGALAMLLTMVFAMKQKEKESKIAATIGAILLILGICFFLFGKGLTCDLDIMTSEGNPITYSLSYGFFLFIGFAAWSAALAVDYLMTFRPTKPLAPLPTKKNSEEEA